MKPYTFKPVSLYIKVPLLACSCLNENGSPHPQFYRGMVSGVLAQEEPSVLQVLQVLVVLPSVLEHPQLAL